MPEMTLHDKQLEAYLSEKPVTIMLSGIQGGKTTCGALWLRRRVSKVTDSNMNFLVTAPTVKIFNQSTEPKFHEFFNGLGKYNKSEHVFEMNRKRKIFLRSLHEPDSIEGMTNVQGIWSDELGKCNLKAWTNIQGRAAFKRAPVFGTTTPYALNWLWKDIYKPWKQGKRPDVSVIQFASIDNPHFPKEEYERQKRLLDPRVFAMKYQGHFERMAGLVYSDIHEDDNFADPFKPNPRDYYIIAGVDFGFTNPFAVSIRAMHRREKKDFQIGEIYRTNQTPSDVVRILLSIQNAVGVETFYCDSEDPGTIADLQRAGVRAVAVRKEKDSVKNGIMAHTALIRSREYKMFKGKCGHSEDEYATYHYEEDDGEEENLKEEPVNAHNHLMDANRYATWMTKSFREEREKKDLTFPVYTDSQLEMAGFFVDRSERSQDWYDD